MLRSIAALFIGLLLAGCADSPESSSSETRDAEADSEVVFRDVSASHLPTDSLDGLSMDAMPGDVDGDGDLDLLIANEFRPNILLLNDGSGRFTDGSDRIPSADRDSEDVALADFDGDGDLDAVVVSEDDRINEYYENQGDGTFTDVGDRWPVEGTSNAVVAADLTGDGFPDLVVGNNGQNALLVNDGSGGFTDATADRLPARDDVTQDIELADLDGDGDLDLLVGNEDANRVLFNDGTGIFTDAPDDALPLRDAPEETREADAGDVDGDGDLDLFFANVRFFVQDADRQSRLLLNDGTGRFTDVTADRLPTDSLSTVDADFIDLDGDGDLDVLTSNSAVEGQSIVGRRYRVLENRDGRFVDATSAFFPETVTGRGFDSEAADFDGDGRVDLFLCSRGTADRLLLQTADAE